MKNQFNIEHAFPGICTKCFTEVAEFNGSDRNGKPVISKFLPNHVNIEIGLSDKTKMTITLCTDCAKKLAEEDKKKIMESEQKGWQWELNNCLKTWAKEKKEDYLKDYNKLEIVSMPKMKKKKPVIIKPIKKGK